MTPGGSSRHFSASVEPASNGRARIPVPFDPNDVWGSKREHHVTGTVAGMGIRGSVTHDERGWSFSLGPAWLRDCPIGLHDLVNVVVAPEGPQRADLAPDFAAALDANRSAGEFFDALAQFYRNAYIRWIDATKRRPELRADRIREVVELLSAGEKSRPR